VISALVYGAAALAEIAGCFAFWSVFRAKAPLAWLLPGLGALVLFAFLLTLTPAASAGRTFAVYGGVYIAASLAWLWAVEGIRPDRFDMLGGAIALVGAAVILWGPRAG